MVRYTVKAKQTKKGRDNSAEALILLSYSYEGVRLRMSTGERIAPRDWNTKTSRPRSGAPNGDILTTYLDRLELKVKQVHLTLRADMTVITPNRLKEAIQAELRNKGGAETLLQWANRYTESKRPNKALHQNCHSTYLLLEEYPGAKNFADIGEEWFGKFTRWMESYRSDEMPDGYKSNYIHKAVRYIKEFCNEARRAGVTKSAGWVDMKFRVKQDEVQSIYLTNGELIRMHNKQLPKHLRSAADRFLIGAFTGLRFSDFSQITHQAIRGGLVYNRNIKTGDNVIIPVHPVVSEIFNRYKGKLPTAISNQKMNKALKEIGRLCEIDSPVQITSNRGGRTVTTTVSKYELITTHTARRSAATNMYLAGIPSISIMKITGHKTEKNFMKYIRISQEENARLIKDNQYFRPEQPTRP